MIITNKSDIIITTDNTTAPKRGNNKKERAADVAKVEGMRFLTVKEKMAAKVRGEEAVRRMSDKAQKAYSNTSPLDVYVVERDEINIYMIEGAFSADNLTFEEAEELLEGWGAPEIVEFSNIRELNFKDGARELLNAGYVESYEKSDSSIYDYSSDTVFTLYDENDEVVHQVVYAEYYNKNEDFAGDDDYDGTEDHLMMAKWEEI